MIWGSMVPPLSQKWLLLTNLGQGLSQKVGFFLIFEPIYELAFFYKMLTLSNEKSVLVSGSFGCCTFAVLLKFYLKGRLLTKKAP